MWWRSRFAIAVMAAALMTLPSTALGTDEQPERDWTVLMYFGADNDLYQATEFCVEQALKGLSEAAADGSKVAVVLLIDGPNNGDTRVYELTKDGRTDLTSSALGTGNVERKMTDPQTMIEFLNWAMPAYPAGKTMLVLKNGHAWCGICPDETDNAGDEKILMPIDDIRYALETVHTDPALWVDVLVLDGDNMGSIEVAYQLREVTSYFVGFAAAGPVGGAAVLPVHEGPRHDADDGCRRRPASAMVDDFVLYYNNTKGNKQIYDKLLANSQMDVTAAVFQMGVDGERIAGCRQLLRRLPGLHAPRRFCPMRSSLGGGLGH